ncbi:hypothetical protein BDA99DRAFT_405001, partial [Phascolomyces articulosus]
IRVHHGAVDCATLTSRVPSEIINEVRQILQALGIEYKQEGHYKIKCSRRAAKTMMSSYTYNEEEERQGNISNTRQQQPIYGDPSIDSGEEIRFVVEICRFRNLPGLYIVDVRRLRGNVWTYKFLYHKL